MGRPRIVIVGAGFAGFRAARRLARIARGRAEIVVINPTDYFLYVPLLPEVGGGLLDPRRVAVSLPAALPDVRLVLGAVEEIDMGARRVRYRDPEGAGGATAYDRLVLAVGSVNKLLPVPGAAEHAHGFRGIPEALYLRDHVIRQMELAATAADPAERAARRTFVVVGAGYTGTEVAAHGVLLTRALARRRPRAGEPARWLLLDLAPRVLPELDARMSRTAEHVLRRRGVQVRTRTSIREATGEGVRLSDGTFVPTRTVVWCVGVRPDPLVDGLGLETVKGRLVVGEDLTVPGHPEIYACGDAAAVPDPAAGPGAVTPMTAQHAVRQGDLAARNIAASYGDGVRRPYRHRDLGFVVDLGGADAAADPLGVPLSGLVAKTVTRGYHLLSLPGNRTRTAADWLLNVLLGRPTVQLGLVRSPLVPLDTDSPELPLIHH